MFRRVYVSKCDRDKLAHQFGVSASTISESLSYKRNRPQNRAIRFYAMNNLNGTLVYYDDGKND